MTTIKHIVEQIEHDWIDDPVIKLICMNVFEYITGREQQDIKHITYANLRDLTNNKFDEGILLQATKYLCSSSLLKIGFEFIDDSNDSYILEPVDLIEARQDGYLTHPGNGRDEISNFEEMVFYFFSPTNLARSL